MIKHISYHAAGARTSHCPTHSWQPKVLGALEIEQPKLVIKLFMSKLHDELNDGQGLLPLVGEGELDRILAEHHQHGESGPDGLRELQRKLALFLKQVRAAPAPQLPLFAKRLLAGALDSVSTRAELRCQISVCPVLVLSQCTELHVCVRVCVLIQCACAQSHTTEYCRRTCLPTFLCNEVPILYISCLGLHGTGCWFGGAAQCVLPLAIQTRAVVMVGDSGCALSQAFNSICQQESGKTQDGSLPFTVISVQGADALYPAVHATKESTAAKVATASRRWGRNVQDELQDAHRTYTSSVPGVRERPSG